MDGNRRFDGSATSEITPKVIDVRASPTNSRSNERSARNPPSARPAITSCGVGNLAPGSASAWSGSGPAWPTTSRSRKPSARNASRRAGGSPRSHSSWESADPADSDSPPALDGDRTLVLAFGATELLDDPGPIHELHRAYPRSHMIGCSSAGEIAGAPELAEGWRKERLGEACEPADQALRPGPEGLFGPARGPEQVRHQREVGPDGSREQKRWSPGGDHAASRSASPAGCGRTSSSASSRSSSRLAPSRPPRTRRRAAVRQAAARRPRDDRRRRRREDLARLRAGGRAAAGGSGTCDPGSLSDRASGVSRAAERSAGRVSARPSPSGTAFSRPRR